MPVYISFFLLNKQIFLVAQTLGFYNGFITTYDGNGDQTILNGPLFCYHVVYGTTLIQ